MNRVERIMLTEAQREKREHHRRVPVDECAGAADQGTSGNISLRDGEGFLITRPARPTTSFSRRHHRDALRPQRRRQWAAVDGVAVPSRHPRARPEVNAIVHAHPIYCTTLAIMERSIPPIHYMVCAAGGDTIRCAPYATFGTQELSDNAVAALKDRKACLLAHHGMIAVGDDLRGAMWLAVEVETSPISTSIACSSAASRRC